MAAATFVLMCIAFLLREIEGALITVGQATVVDGPDGKTLRLFLPVSKVDHWGAGVSRSLVCVCAVEGRFKFPCVACRVEAQLLIRRGESAGKDAPLFPDGEGRFPSKEGSVATLAALLTPLEGKITGHTPRRMGAQLLAALGVSEATICWFGRWGSAAVKAYLADARARSRSGKRIWSDALSADAASSSSAGAPATRTVEATARRLEADKAAAPASQRRVASVKTYVLNSETRRLHVFAAGAAVSLCSYFNLDMPSACPNPALQGKMYKGRTV